MVETESLNEYSLKVYNYLKLNFSFYLNNILIKSCQNFDGSYLKFEIDPLNKNVSHKLTFDTVNNQLTLCFDNYHCHYDNFYESDFINEIQNAIDTISKIMLDELIVLSYYHNNKVIMSKMVKSNYSIIFEINTFDKSKYKIDKIKSTSFSGLLDKESIII